MTDILTYFMCVRERERGDFCWCNAEDKIQTIKTVLFNKNHMLHIEALSFNSLLVCWINHIQHWKCNKPECSHRNRILKSSTRVSYKFLCLKFVHVSISLCTLGPNLCLHWWFWRLWWRLNDIANQLALSRNRYFFYNRMN